MSRVLPPASQATPPTAPPTAPPAAPPTARSTAPSAAPARSARASGWSSTHERSNRLALRLMAWIALACGRRVARGLLHPITLYFLCFGPSARRHSARYLGRALGRPAGWRDRYRHLHAFAATVLDRVYFARGQMQHFDLRVSGGPLVDTTLDEGRGAVLLGAHLGSFEALHASGQSQHGRRVAMAMYPDNARLMHGLLRAIAPAFQLDIIAIGRSGSALAIRDWLDGGGLVGLLGDRYLPSDRPQAAALELPFLGRPARFADGPLRLALLLRRRVIFMVGLYRGGKRYDVCFEPLADFRQPMADPAERERCVQAALAAYVARLEALCREAPYNWFNFHDFWHEDSPR